MPDPRPGAADVPVEAADSAARRRLGSTLGRLCGLALAAAAIAWIWAVGSYTVVADRELTYVVGLGLLRGETFDADVLEKARQAGERMLGQRFCDSQGDAYLALINMSQATLAIDAGDYGRTNAAIERTEAAAQAAIRCSPLSSLAWLMLASTEFLRDEYSDRFRALMRMSDRTGPMEGWAIMRRVAILMQALEKLDAEDRRRLQQQLMLVLESNELTFVAYLYLDGTPNQRAFLQDLLATATDERQAAAAGIIRRAGDDIDLPAVAPLGARPWK